MPIKFALRKVEPIDSFVGPDVEVPDGNKVVVGREVGDYTFPNNRQMSTSHFSLDVSGTSCILRDLGSTNGTFINGNRVAEQEVRSGDRVRAGEYIWEVAMAQSYDVANHHQPAIASHEMASAFTERPFTGQPFTGQPAMGSPAPALELHLRSSTGEFKRLAPLSSLTVGRTSIAEWPFEADQAMSSIHLEFRHQPTGWKVVDRGSTNGTFVNENRVSDKLLSEGDVVRAGGTNFEVSMVASPTRVTPAHVTPEHEGQFATWSSTPSIPWSAPDRVSSSFQSESQRGRTMVEDGLPPVQPSVDRLKLVVSTSASRTKEWIVRAPDIATLGSGADAELCWKHDPLIASRHAAISLKNGLAEVVDLMTKSGTFLNESRIRSAPLKHGDVIRIGETSLFVLMGDDVDWRLAESTDETEDVAMGQGEAMAYAFGRQPDSPVVDEDTPIRTADYCPSTSQVSQPPLQASQTISDDQELEAVLDKEPELVFSPAQPLRCQAKKWEKGDPIDIARRLLEAYEGYLFDFEQVYGWLSNDGRALLSASDQWLKPTALDDASWMLSVASAWGNQTTWILFRSTSEVEPRRSLLDLIDQTPVGVSMDEFASKFIWLLQESFSPEGWVALLRDDLHGDSLLLYEPSMRVTF